MALPPLSLQCLIDWCGAVKGLVDLAVVVWTWFAFLGTEVLCYSAIPFSAEYQQMGEKAKGAARGRDQQEEKDRRDHPVDGRDGHPMRSIPCALFAV